MVHILYNYLKLYFSLYIMYMNSYDFNMLIHQLHQLLIFQMDYITILYPLIYFNNNIHFFLFSNFHSSHEPSYNNYYFVFNISYANAAIHANFPV